MATTPNIEDYIPAVKYNGLNTAKAVDFSGATSVALPANTTIAGTTASGTSTITSTSANALTVGRQGATDPVLKIDASASSVATGIEVVGAAAASGVNVRAISSGAAENLTINAKGTGTIGIGDVSTGAVTITPATTVTGALTLTAALKSTPQLLTGAGAVNLTTLVTEIVSTGADALTLADGTNGQVKILCMKTDGGDATLTPTTKTGYTTIVFNDAGDGCVLVFVTTVGWLVVGNNGCTIS